MTYENLKDKPKRFLALTGYTLEEFLALLPHFSNETHTLDGSRRKKRKYTCYKNGCLPSFEDAMTQDVGELFGMAQPVANKWIHRLLPDIKSDFGRPQKTVDTSVETHGSNPFFSNARCVQISESDYQLRAKLCFDVVSRQDIDADATTITQWQCFISRKGLTPFENSQLKGSTIDFAIGSPQKISCATLSFMAMIRCGSRCYLTNRTSINTVEKTTSREYIKTESISRT